VWNEVIGLGKAMDQVEPAGAPAGSRRGPGPHRWPPLLAALVVASPIVVAAVAMTRGPWFPVGDFAHMVFRTSQVGTGDTPLVGAYTTKGWAHPGPLLFWIAAPLYRLSGLDPRSVEWTTAGVNVASIVAVLLVAWRRGGLALLVATGLLVALLVRGLGPEELVVFWNPYVPLLPFLLTVVLAWDAGLGRLRSASWAVVPASVAIQGHFAFVVLVAVVAGWLVAWLRWGDRLVAPASAPAPADTAAAVEPSPSPSPSPGPARRLWRASPRWLVPAVAIMWIGPVVDAVADLHNPLAVARSFAASHASVGPVGAVDLVGRYVRPDGPWMGGPEPTGLDFSVRGSGAVPLLIAIVALGWCLRTARRRQLRDVAALTTLTLVLLVCSIPATAQIVLPAFTYLLQWLKIVGGLVWFTVAWTVWRVLQPRLAAAAVTLPRRRVATAVAAAGLVPVAAASWPPAADVEQPAAENSTAVVALAPQLAANVPRGRRLRVEPRGDFTASATAGVTYWLIDRGYDVVTSDGGIGLKWGHRHRWTRSENGDDRDDGDEDLVLTAALNQAIGECDRDPSVRRVAAYDALEPDERAWLTDYQFRRLDGPDAVTPTDSRHAEELASRNLRLAVFAGPHVCAAINRPDFGEDNSGWLLPVAAAGAAGAASAGAVAAAVVLRRRRQDREGPAEPQR
jgi:hypothetical protein